MKGLWMTGWMWLALPAGAAVADEAAPMPGMAGMLGAYAMARESSGTSWQPDSTPVQGAQQMSGPWMTMWGGTVDLNQDAQGGPRGDTKTFSSSVLMFMARDALTDGAFGLRLMVSGDPLMGRSGYPELFQTGETADGVHPLVDRQHPHNLLMEAAVSYARDLSAASSAYLYAGLAGEPALGPPAFMHRFSGADDPLAPLGHHWLDSTHVTYGVVTAGLSWGPGKLELSSFNGREPDENRYSVQLHAPDSYAVRASLNPAADWALQVSSGRLASPEQLQPLVSVRRTTASASYNRMSPRIEWQTTAAWGRNEPDIGRSSEAWLLESALVVERRHTVFLRLERVGKDELFAPGQPLFGQLFTVQSATLGGIEDFWRVAQARIGVGAAVSGYRTPATLNPYYGAGPTSYLVFLRVRL